MATQQGRRIAPTVRQAVARGERATPTRTRTRSRRPGAGRRSPRRAAGAPRRGKAAATAPLPLGPALAFLRDLRAGMEAGRTRSARSPAPRRGLPRDVREGLDAAVRRLAGDYHEDEWGFDEEFAESVFPLLELAVRPLVAGAGRGRRATSRPTAARCSSPTTRGSCPGTRR